jgi:hypothetical protein
VADVKILEPVLKKALAKQGIAAGSVALWHDYAPRSRGKSFSPYAGHYLDNVSGKKFAVISGLPGCDAYGQTHELAWSDKNDTVENGNNIFHAAISKGTVHLLALSDQPTGARNSDEVAFHPQLFIDEAEILPLSDLPRLLEADPANENYHNNVLEWNYGVCLRRIRVIEGNFLGSWVFVASPKGDVLIKYNQSGKIKLRLQYAKDDDTEFIPKSFFDTARSYPVTISDSLTFYPDANPETSSVDGFITRGATQELWSAIIAGAGTNAYPSNPSGGPGASIGGGTTANYWVYNSRTILLFDTSAIPDNAEITAAVLSMYGSSKASVGGAIPNTNVYASTPASNTDLVTTDYSQVGSTPFCDTAITYANWNVATPFWNDFALNAAGIAAISLTGVSKFSLRNANYDVAASQPPWTSGGVSYLDGYLSEQGTGYQPKLVVTYTTGVTEKTSADLCSGIDVKDDYPAVALENSETGSGVDAKSDYPAALLAGPETGTGTDAGSGYFPAILASPESGLGTDVSSWLAVLLQAIETASGSELAAVGRDSTALLASDYGGGSELGTLLKTVLIGDAGGGADALKSLIKMAGSNSDIRLYEGLGQEKIPSRQTGMPNKEVNI